MTRKTDSPRIEFSNIFNKQLKKAPREMKIAFREALELFLEDPNSSHLRNHPLTREYAGYNSIDVTGDWRALFIKTLDEKGNKTILFKFIGTHSQLYQR